MPLFCLMSAFLLPSTAPGKPQIRITLDDARQRVTYLTWDTEGGDRVERNLLKADRGATVKIETYGNWLPLEPRGVLSQQERAGGTDLRIAINKETVVAGRLLITFAFDAGVLSDPASCSLWMYADMALFVPELPGGIGSAQFVRRSLDHWLDNRMQPNGNVIGYWGYDEFLDGPPSILISFYRPAGAHWSM